jgi:branched-subunit amino acid transport protein
MLTSTEFLMLAGMMAVTFGTRYSMFTLAGRVEFPGWLVNALRYVPPVVLTAIIVPAVLIPGGGTVQVSYTNPYLVGGLVACGVGWLSKNLLSTIVLGTLAFWGWQWLLLSWLG